MSRRELSELCEVSDSGAEAQLLDTTGLEEKLIVLVVR